MACRGLWISAGGYCQTGRVFDLLSRKGQERRAQGLGKEIFVKEVRGGLLQWEASDCYW